jgi:hypothetical protein
MGNSTTLPPLVCRSSPSLGGWIRSDWRRHKGIRCHAQSWYCMPIGQRLEQPSPYGPEKGRRLAPLRRFPPPQPHNRGGEVSASKHAGSLCQASRLLVFHQAGSSKGLSPGTSAAVGRPKNGGHHTVRLIRVCQNAVQIKGRRHDLSKVDGQHPQRPTLRFRLHPPAYSSLSECHSD